MARLALAAHGCLLGAALLLAGCVAVPGAAPDLLTARITIPSVAGEATAFRYAPAARAVRGTVVFVHGFPRSAARHEALAMRLAREGFLVLLPELAASAAADARQRDVLQVLALTVTAGVQRSDGRAGVSHPLFLGGFSRGSGIALEVAARLEGPMRPQLAGVLLVDPVLPKSVLAPLRDQGVAVALIAAPAAPCNARGVSVEPIRSTLRPVLDLIVPDATHCDPESPSDLLCALWCGAPDPARQARFEDAMVDFILSRAPR